MTVVVDNLAKDGYVERIAHPEDRRAIVIRLTEKGQKKFEEIFTQHAKCVEELCSVLTEQEQKELSGLLKKLGTSLIKKV